MGIMKTLYTLRNEGNVAVKNRTNPKKKKKAKKGKARGGRRPLGPPTAGTLDIMEELMPIGDPIEEIEEEEEEEEDDWTVIEPVDPESE